jgi:hypothetical protein
MLELVERRERDRVGIGMSRRRPMALWQHQEAAHRSHYHSHRR